MKRDVPVIALAALLFAAGIALAADLLNVKIREATVRSGPKHFKPAVATLQYGDQVERLDEKDGWFQVRTRGGAVGFLHESAVTDEKLAALPAGAGAAPSSVSRDEVSLAGKGFNPQVEKKYREQRPNLEAQFRKVDAMERRAIGAAELDQFLREGQLGQYGRQP